MVKVTVPATTANLGPGFDTFGMALDMYNIVEMEIHDTVEITVSGEGETEISLDKSNIVYQAAEKVFEKVGKNLSGLKINLINQVPVARGLGSSAAAVVGGVVAANALLDYPLNEQELAELVTEIEGHPDNVLPALLGGIVIAGWANNKLLYKRITDIEPINAVVAIPDFRLSTKHCRQVLPEKIDFKDAIFNINRAALLVSALMTKDFKLLSEVMEDKLHQPYRSQLIPGMDEIISQAKDAGALGVVLSGAGPTMLALTIDNTEKVINVMSQIFTKYGVKSTVKSLKPVTNGVIIQ